MRKLLFVISILSLNAFAGNNTEDVIAEFIDAFDKAECMAIATSRNYGDAKEYFAEVTSDAYGNAPSYRGVDITTDTKSVFEALDYQLDFCDNSKYSEIAQEKLKDIALSFQVFGAIRELHDTGDDDSTDWYTIVMKNGTALGVEFGN